MKKTLLILGGVALVFILLVVRLFVVEGSSVRTEQEWFARELQYEFSAVVDSIRMFNGASGNLRGRITAGDPKTSREDSLKRHFKKHDMMYLIYKHSSDSIIFILPYANQVRKGDSLRISSSENRIEIFRNHQSVFHHPLSESLVAYQRPPFVKD
jgi:hypothetical protein